MSLEGLGGHTPEIRASDAEREYVVDVLRGHCGEGRIDLDELSERVNRVYTARTIGELKKADGSPAFRPDREAAVIDGLKAKNAGPLPADSVAPIWREIMSACRALETPTRVAYLGPAGTFSELAALGYFGSSIVKVPCANADEVFHATSAGAADFGVVPVENSSEGVVTRSLDLFLTTPLIIVGETSLYVRHNLLRRTDSTEGIVAVCAHPQALAQCHVWLSHHLPNAERRPVASNAEGARRARGSDDAAAIAGESAAHVYGLKKVIMRPIQDDRDNTTRFLVVGRQIFPPSGHDRTSVLVFIHDKPGALFDVLSPFAKHGISMNRIESRPAHGHLWQYAFFIDVAGHCAESPLKDALAEVAEKGDEVRVLGSYPVAIL